MFEVEHVAVNADDVAASLAFYTAALGWEFEPWGPPDFHRTTLPNGVIVAIQQRRELMAGTRTVGAEVTVAVDELGSCLERVRGAGGQILMPPTDIPGVGTVAFVADPAGNPLGLIERAP